MKSRYKLRIFRLSINFIKLFIFLKQVSSTCMGTLFYLILLKLIECNTGNSKLKCT